MNTVITLDREDFSDQISMHFAELILLSKNMRYSANTKKVTVFLSNIRNLLAMQLILKLP